MKKTISFSILLLISIVLHAQSRKNLPTHYNSYNEAIHKIENATFKISDQINCYNSSWISSASFYSCNGKTGFFILYANNGRSYIHKGMPISMWKQFKTANSFGSYYSINIKGRYLFKL